MGVFNSRAPNAEAARRNCSVSIWVLLLSNLLVYQAMVVLMSTEKLHHVPSAESVGETVQAPWGQATLSVGWNPLDPLALPAGQAINLPSVRIKDEKADAQRQNTYGGKGDGKHLGGFTTFDGHGVSPLVWTHMIQDYGVHSLLDVGCGRGISTRWFLEHGVDVLCVEGSHDAVENSFLPLDRIVEHDYSRGPWWPGKTYDAVWSVEFLEHVSRQYHFNYISTFRKAALLFVTSSQWGGWHHVEIHPNDWWILKYESYGFRYSPQLTEQVKNWTTAEWRDPSLRNPDGKRRFAQHVNLSVKVFINPMVAALPQHAHLFPRDGCYKSDAPRGSKFRSLTKPCTNDLTSSALPESFNPLQVTPDMHERWEKAIQDGLQRKVST